MTIAGNLNTTLNFDIETTAGTTDASPGFTAVQIVSHNLKKNTDTVQSQIAQSTGDVRDIIRTGAFVGGTINSELIYDEFNTFFTSLMRSSWVTFTVTGSSDISFANATSTITGNTGDFTNLVAGALIKVTGTSNNNGTYRITTKTDNENIIVDGTLTDESNTSATIAGDWIVNGVTPVSMTLEDKETGIAEYTRWLGCQIGSFGLNFSNGSIASVTFGVQGMSESTGQAILSGATYAASGGASNDVFDASNNITAIYENGAANSAFRPKTMSFNIDNALGRRSVCANANDVGVRSDQMTGTGSISAYFEDDSVYSDYSGGTESSFDVRCQDNDGNIWAIWFPAIRYTDGSKPYQGLGNDRMQDLTFGIKRSTTYSCAVMISKIDA